MKLTSILLTMFLLTGILIALPAVAVGLICGFKWGIAVWLILMFLNATSVIANKSLVKKLQKACE